MTSLYLKHFAASLLRGVRSAACSAVDRIENIGEAAQAGAGRQSRRQPDQPVDDPRSRRPIAHADNSLWQPGAHSFFHDPRASHVGDVITVDVTVADAARSPTPPRARAPIPTTPT